MIEQAAQTLKSQGLSDRIELLQSPAEKIPLEDGSVDFISSGILALVLAPTMLYG